MAYKRNPMRCERMTGLSRYVLSIMTSPFQTAAEQWFERTLDDSSNKRVTTPEGFLAVDGILRLVTDVSRGLVVYPKVIDANVQAELPFMATEEILMAAVAGDGKRGNSTGDRQELHERIRTHSMAAAEQVKLHGRANDLMDRLKNDDAFSGVDLDAALDAKRFVGLSVEQVDHFVKTFVSPILRRHRAARNKPVSLSV